MRYLTRAQVREVDRKSIVDYGIPGIVLMENAARAASQAAIEMLPPSVTRPVLILCGGGANGGDGLAVARYLHNAGYPVFIALTVDPARYTGDALTNYRIVCAMNLPIQPATAAMIAEAGPYSLIIDAIFGTGLEQPPRAPFSELADAVNTSLTPVLAIDVPSGLDCDTGRPLGACIRATRTVTFVALKAGFANPESQAFTGNVSVGDIACPRELYA